MHCTHYTLHILYSPSLKDPSHSTPLDLNTLKDQFSPLATSSYQVLFQIINNYKMTTSSYQVLGSLDLLYEEDPLMVLQDVKEITEHTKIMKERVY